MNTVIIIIAGVLIVLVLYGIGVYNKLVNAKNKVANQFSQVDIQLKRRADLIPNLVNTVKGYTNHENEIIDKVTEARTKLVNANSVEEKTTANDELTSSLNALMVVVENYPDLKSSDNFKQLSDELAGTENRISVARKDYNDAVNIFNTTIKRFPNNIVAGMFGFEKATYFKADEKSQEVPSVNFE